MNMKKTFILTISALLATASAFAWSKKTDGQANIGRMYVAVEGGAQFNKFRDTTTGDKHSSTAAATAITFNVPLLKPNVNVLKDVSWVGVDAQAYFNLNGGDITDSSNFLKYGAGIAIVPYLNFEMDWDFLQAIKPFVYGKVGYEWSSFGGSANSISNFNYLTYGGGGGLEFVITDALSVTGAWNWFGNDRTGLPVSTSISADATYWLNGMFGFSIFAEHNFGADRVFGSNTTFDHMHGTTIGMRFKVGFNR